MALTAYLTATANLLQSPTAPTSLYDPATLTTYINTARQQLAIEGECVRVITQQNTAAGTRPYLFSDFGALPSGVASVLHVRMLLLNSGSGQKALFTHAWPYFQQYYMNNVAPVQATPQRWAQFAQGVLGSIYLDPIPDATYVMNLDTVCVPSALASDSDPEAIPYPWTDCVCYFAAYLALLSAQSPARVADGDNMLKRYAEFMQRARQFSNPDQMRSHYLQGNDPATAAKFGLQLGGGGQPQ